MPEPYVTIARDPFARGELVRRTLPRADRGPCRECGQPGRFQYDWSDDARDRAFQRRPFARFEYSDCFCSVGCFRSYAG
jgi:hypothetical protein